MKCGEGCWRHRLALKESQRSSPITKKILKSLEGSKFSPTGFQSPCKRVVSVFLLSLPPPVALYSTVGTTRHSPLATRHSPLATRRHPALANGIDFPMGFPRRFSCCRFGASGNSESGKRNPAGRIFMSNMLAVMLF